MALNTWWTGDPAQRYWMEITHREDTGTDLQAPRLDGGQWSYDLVNEVQPEDRVLHWHGSSRSIIGWSEVTGPARTIPHYTWQPRGTVGRAAGPRTSRGWVAPLGGLNDLPSGPSLTTLAPLLDRLMDLNSDLEARVGKPSYFPFYRYGGDRLRTQQAYLVKFPAELFDLVPGIAEARISPGIGLDDEIHEDDQPPGQRAPHGKTTRVQDPELRAAIERRSLDVALEYYAGLGGTNFRELGKPFDLVVSVAGIERHCEVKGSSMLIDAVELTVNEVEHARRCPHADLIVVDNIQVRRTRIGQLVGEGGDLRVWVDWTPHDHALHEKRYAYDLPAGGSCLSRTAVSDT